MKTKIEPTQEEIFTSREEAGGSLVTLTPDSFDLEEDSKMERNRRNDGSSDWSGRGSRSRGSSTV